MHNPPTKLEILTFIRDRKIIWIRDLVSEFGYEYWGAVSRLKRLCREGLVTAIYVRGLNQGRYVLTERGYARIDYLTEVKQASQLQEDELKSEIDRLSERVRELEKENEKLRNLYLMMQGKGRA